MAKEKPKFDWAAAEQSQKDLSELSGKVWQIALVGTEHLLSFESKIYSFGMALNTGAIAYVLVFVSQKNIELENSLIFSLGFFVMGIIQITHKIITHKNRIKRQTEAAMTILNMTNELKNAIREKDEKSFVESANGAYKAQYAVSNMDFKTYLDYMPLLYFIAGGSFFLYGII